MLRFDGRLTELDRTSVQLASLLVRLLHDADDRCLVAQDLILDTGLFLLDAILVLKSLACRELDKSL